MENGHSDLQEELESAGTVVLDKNYVDIEVNGTQVRLGGLYDYAFGLTATMMRSLLRAIRSISCRIFRIRTG